MSSTQSESQPQRSVSNFISSIPIVTKTLLLLNCSVYLLSTVLGRSTQADALSPAAALPPNYELTRMITYAFVHMSFLHLLMNMVTLWQLGTSLEQQFGSMPFIFLTGTGLIWIPIIYIFLEWCAYEIFSSESYLVSSVVGYSGVLFMYAVVDSFHQSSTSRLTFGVEIPSYLYPFLMLFLLQILVPGVSFVGHVSGVLVGLLIVYGFCMRCFPSQATIISNCESPDCLLYTLAMSSSYVQVNTSQPCGYVLSPGIDSSQMRNQEFICCCISNNESCNNVWQYIRQCRESIRNCIGLSNTMGTHEYGSVPDEMQLPPASSDRTLVHSNSSNVANMVFVDSGASDLIPKSTVDGTIVRQERSGELSRGEVQAIRVAKFQKT